MKRHGVVIFDDRDGEEGRAQWSVLFDDEEELSPEVPSSHLALIKAQRKFVWRLVKDSVPDNPLHHNTHHGVIGFDFGKKFEPTKFESEDDRVPYDFPFLGLLQHLWPGTWQQQLLRLNTAIDNQNRSGRRRSMSALSGEFMLLIVDKQALN